MSSILELSNANSDAALMRSVINLCKNALVRTVVFEWQLRLKLDTLGREDILETDIFKIGGFKW